MSEVKARANSIVAAIRRLVETSLDMISPCLEFGTSPHGERAETQLFHCPHRHLSYREFSERCDCSTFREKNGNRGISAFVDACSIKRRDPACKVNATKREA